MCLLLLILHISSAWKGGEFLQSHHQHFFYHFYLNCNIIRYARTRTRDWTTCWPTLVANTRKRWKSMRTSWTGSSTHVYVLHFQGHPQMAPSLPPRSGVNLSIDSKRGGGVSLFGNCPTKNLVQICWELQEEGGMYWTNFVAIVGKVYMNLVSGDLMQ